MNFKKYLLLASVGLMAVACQDKIDVNSNKPGQDGDNVSFGAVVESTPESRTIYGNKTGNSFPIYWLNSDSMIVASPQCAEGRNQAMYKVDAADGSKAAGKLVRVSDIGVQWGSTYDKAKFYSIYPQRKDNLVTTTNCTEFSIKMPTFQTCIVGANDEPDSDKGGLDKQIMKTADMYACFMYAKDLGKEGEGVEKHTTVNLHYTPFSTAIRFKLTAPEDSVGILRVDLIAPQNCNIGGKYNVDLDPDTGEYTATATEGTNKVSVVARYDNQAYLQMANGEEIELNVFLMLETGKPAGTYTISDSWKIQVTLTDNTVLTKNLGGTAESPDNLTLTPGKIHYLPDLPALVPGEWSNADWMKNIPRNVYLSEISVPGSWSSLNSIYQDKYNQLLTQYALGCRAFHLDTRYRATSVTTHTTWTSRVSDLGIANGTTTMTVVGEEGTCMDVDNVKSLKAYIDTITTPFVRMDQQQKEQNEYMYIYCTFALDSYQKDGTTWIKDVSSACDECANNKYIFDARSDISTYYDGEVVLNDSTTVGDVLGKAIVIVGVDQSDITNYSTRLPYSSKCLFAVMPLEQNSGNYPSSPSSILSYSTKVYKMVEGERIECDFTINKTLTQITWVANGNGNNVTNRGYAPNWTQRQGAGKYILNHELQIFNTEGYAHNEWMLFGLGGYTTYKQPSTIFDPSPTSAPSQDWSIQTAPTVAGEMNKWISGIINAMASMPSETQTSYYPIGIQLVNRVGRADSQDAITRTLKLNNKFHKAFDASKPAFK